MKQNNYEYAKEQLNEINMVENLIWEIVKIMMPNSYIDPQKIQEIKTYITSVLKEST
jgi:hypothetical protein